MDQKILDFSVLLKLLSANALPVDYSPEVCREIARIEDVVGNVSKLFQPNMRVKLDTLSDGCCRLVEVNIAEPDGRRNIL